MPPLSLLRRLSASCLLALVLPVAAQTASVADASRVSGSLVAQHQPAMMRTAVSPSAEPLRVAAAASAPPQGSGVHGAHTPADAMGGDPPTFLLFVSALIVVLFISTRRTRRED